MSEFTTNHKLRVEKLTNYIIGLIEGRKGIELLSEYQILETSFLPDDILLLFDNVFDAGYEIEDIKKASNKLFNILYKNLTEIENFNYKKGSIIQLLIDDNSGLKKVLSETKQTIKSLNSEVNKNYIISLIDYFTEIEKFSAHYIVMQNIVFPEIEKQWEHHQCLKVLWSFHDDIIRNIKSTITVLKAEKFDIQLFNSLSSKVYFNINTIIFREEHVLFPVLYNTLSDDIFNKMNHQLSEFPLAFVDSNNAIIDNNDEKIDEDLIVKMSTGELKLSQLELIFNHLPVDITFVDEFDKVLYFSDPKHRIFPRTTGIIGRNVQQCHPHESVHVVVSIVEAFKNGEKDVASFWIPMGDKFVLIKYFAVRDKENNYKGVLEVSQEISDIKKLEGERRLLDW